LLLICLTSAAWAFNFGLGSQVVSRWLNVQGISDTVIGLNHSFYYFGVAVGSCFVPLLTRRLSPAWCAALGMVVSGFTLAVYPWGGSDAVWCALRFVNGCASAMALVPLETLVSRDSPLQRKTQNFACYGVSLTLGGALGIETAPHLYHLGSTLAFQLGGCVPCVAGLVLLFGLRRRPTETYVGEARTPLGWGRNFLSYGTAWGQGFLEGGMLAFLALFLIARGFSNAEAGTLMSVTMVGVIVFQVPVSWLADRFGKMPLLLACHGVVIAGLLAIPWLSNSIVLAAGLFCFGACTGAMYPLGLSLLSDRMPNNGLARAYAWYLAVECVGSQAGAAAMGKARDLWGEASMFAVGVAALAGVLAIWLALRYAWPGEERCAIDVPSNREAA
jgi:MFS family permease